MVVWIIGLSGAGKTTLANEVVSKVRRKHRNIVLLDGDAIREVFGNDLGHSIDDRRRNADRISQLSKFLDDQGINIVCAILSLFPESRSWNRQNIKHYYEVFIDAPIEDLINRDSKSIYHRYLDGEIRNVAGMDIEFKKPDNPDLVIENISSLNLLLSYSDRIVEIITES